MNSIKYYMQYHVYNFRDITMFPSTTTSSTAPTHFLYFNACIHQTPKIIIIASCWCWCVGGHVKANSGVSKSSRQALYNQSCSINIHHHHCHYYNHQWTLLRLRLTRFTLPPPLSSLWRCLHWIESAPTPPISAPHWSYSAEAASVVLVEGVLGSS